MSIFKTSQNAIDNLKYSISGLSQSDFLFPDSASRDSTNHTEILENKYVTHEHSHLTVFYKHYDIDTVQNIIKM